MNLAHLGKSLSSAGPRRRAELLDLLSAALAAVEPEAAVHRALEGRPLTPEGRVVVLAFGKAAAAMARGAHAALGEIDLGLVVTDRASPLPPPFEVLVSSHPVPDQRSVEAGRRLLKLAASTGPDDAVLYLVSGGASALVEVPAPGLDLADLAAVTTLLSNAGAPIEDLNTVRTHLSAIKGGRLGAATGGRTLSLILSDVVDSPLHAVASGPTVACPSVPADALAVLERYELQGIPPSVVSVLAAAPPPPPVVGEAMLVGSGGTAAEAAVRRGAQIGIPISLATGLDGIARHTAGRVLAGSPPGTVSVLAGETTVEVRGEGRGGRNQEAALAAAIDLAGTRSVFVALGTDGVDGPTDAAGAMVDGGTVGRAGGLDPLDYLARNDSHRFLEAAGALIRTGPTGTNVGDLWLVDTR